MTHLSHAIHKICIQHYCDNEIEYKPRNGFLLITSFKYECSYKCHVYDPYCTRKLYCSCYFQCLFTICCTCSYYRTSVMYCYCRPCTKLLLIQSNIMPNYRENKESYSI